MKDKWTHALCSQSRFGGAKWMPFCWTKFANLVVISQNFADIHARRCILVTGGISDAARPHQEPRSYSGFTLYQASLWWVMQALAEVARAQKCSQVFSSISPNQTVVTLAHFLATSRAPRAPTRAPASAEDGARAPPTKKKETF